MSLVEEDPSLEAHDKYSSLVEEAPSLVEAVSVLVAVAVEEEEEDDDDDDKEPSLTLGGGWVLRALLALVWAICEEVVRAGSLLLAKGHKDLGVLGKVRAMEGAERRDSLCSLLKLKRCLSLEPYLEEANEELLVCLEEDEEEKVGEHGSVVVKG